MNRTINLSVLLAITSNLNAADSIVDRVREGNRLFREEKLTEAMNKYQDARTDSPESPELHYNIGNVYFSENRFQDAANSYEKAALKGDLALKSKAHYNLGNTTYRMAQQKESSENLQESLALAKKALDHYKDARHLRKNAMGPDFTESSDLNHNIQFAQREVRRIRDKILQKQKEQNEKQQGDKEEEKQDKSQSQENPEQNPQQPNENEKQKNEQQDQKEGEKESEQQKPQEDQEQKSDEKSKKEPGEEKQEQQQQQAQKLTPEQAKRMLEQLTDKEKEELKKRMMKYGGGRYVEKDW